jgi:hypothetical protein
VNKKHPDNLSTNRKAQKLLYDHTPIGLGLVPWLLADSGLLDGCSATIHRREIEEFAETFHNLTVSQRRFVKSSRVYICGGASTILDLMFEILSELFAQKPHAKLQACSCIPAKWQQDHFVPHIYSCSWNWQSFSLVANVGCDGLHHSICD